jgi:hypothetical protein
LTEPDNREASIPQYGRIAKGGIGDALLPVMEDVEVGRTARAGPIDRNAPAVKLSGSRLAAITCRTSDCSSEIGTGRLLDLFGEPSRSHVALRAELARDSQDLFNRRILELPDVPCARERNSAKARR